MKRDDLVSRLEGDGPPWDIVIIGGGASGLGAAIDASSRGYRTLLLEQHDFAKGTSSRSTKLVHGGVRYLQQGNIALVRGALHERGILRRNAPHLVRELGFIVPNYDWWEGPWYGIGLRMYDVLAGRLGLGRSRNLSVPDALEHLPTLDAHGLRGGVLYYDAQFDDARLAVNMAQTALEQGATALNYMEVTGLSKNEGRVDGVVARDVETGIEHTIKAKVVINATGVFTDSIRRMDDAQATRMIAPSQGVHIVLDKEFLPGECALMVPRTDDGRVLFAIPWHGVVVVGTTDTPVPDPKLEPHPFEAEIDFLIRHVGRYLGRTPKRSEVLSTFAGLRPLVKAGESKNTAALSRDHTIRISPSGLVTLAGGKWTTYRKMARDVVSRAAREAGLPEQPCPTDTLPIHGHTREVVEGTLAVYGSDAEAVAQLGSDDPALADALHPDLPITGAQVVWAVRHEMARTVEDVLARRTRCLLLDARASIEVAAKVAALMAAELGRERDWIEEETQRYSDLAQGYVLD